MSRNACTDLGGATDFVVVVVGGDFAVGLDDVVVVVDAVAVAVVVAWGHPGLCVRHQPWLV